MNFLKEIKKGIFVASHSFNMIWDNLYLLFYLSVPILFNFIVNIIVYNKIVLVSEDFSLAYLCYYFSYFFIIIFATCCLIMHTNNLINKQSSKIIDIILATFSNIQQIFIWTILSSIPMLTWHIVPLINQENIPHILYPTISFTPLIIGSIWAILTVFSLSIIANEKKNIIQIFAKSFLILKNKIFIYFGGIFLIGLFLLCNMILFMAIEYYIFAPSVTIISHISTTISGCIFSTCHTILKTILYNQYINNH